MEEMRVVYNCVACSVAAYSYYYARTDSSRGFGDWVRLR